MKKIQLGTLTLAIALGIWTPVALTDTGRPTTQSATVQAATRSTGEIGEGVKFDLNGHTLTLSGGELEGNDIFEAIAVRTQVEDDPVTKDDLEKTVTKIVIKNVKAPEDCRALFAMENVEAIEGLATLDTSATTSMDRMFVGASSLTSVDVSHWDTSQVTDMQYMFYETLKLTSLDISHWDTSQVTNMASMFSSTGLTDLKLGDLDTSQVENMEDLFHNAQNLVNVDVSGLDTGQVTNMNHMFAYMINVKELNVSGFDTSNVEDMSGMFQNALALNKLDVSHFDTSNVTNMQEMFWMFASSEHLGNPNITELDVTHFDTSNVDNFSGMFAGLSGLKTLDVSQLDTSSARNMWGMFEGMAGLTQLDVSTFDTSSVRDMAQMFAMMPSLKALDLSTFDLSEVEKLDMMFACVPPLDHPKLERLDLSSFDLSSSWITTNNLFVGQENLKELVLGPQARFDRNVERYNPGLPAITADPAKYTQKWVTTTASQPAYTSDELIDRYQAGGQPAGVQTYIWERKAPAPGNNGDDNAGDGNDDNGSTGPETPGGDGNGSAGPEVPGGDGNGSTGPTTPTVPIFPPAPGTDGGNGHETGNSGGSTVTPQDDGEADTGTSNGKFKPFKVYGKQALYQYSGATFDRRHRQAFFTKKARAYAPVFTVVGTAHSKDGRLRYKLANGRYITAHKDFVAPLYWQGKGYRTLYVTNPAGINGYTKAKFTGATQQRHYRQGQALSVVKLVKAGSATRYQLADGTYITGNKQWVSPTKPRQVKQVTVKRTLRLTKDVNGRQLVKRVKPGQRLTVTGWDYTNGHRPTKPGVLRYHVRGGYITANAMFVTAR